MVKDNLRSAFVFYIYNICILIVNLTEYIKIMFMTLIFSVLATCTLRLSPVVVGRVGVGGRSGGPFVFPSCRSLCVSFCPVSC